MTTPPLPIVAPTQVIQVVMTGAFYGAHFKPLLEQQDFTLALVASEDELDTYVLTLGDGRARLLRGPGKT